MSDVRLTPSQRLVLYYMAFEALYNSRTWLTFDDIKRGTGLSTRALRSALVKLRELGYIASIMDPAKGRRLLHRVVLDKLYPAPELEGLYLIDASGDLTPEAVKVLSNADVVLYTESVDPRKLEAYVKALSPFKGEIPRAKLVAIVFNPLLDDMNKLGDVVSKARYICASNAVDKALGTCLACGMVDLDYGKFKIKTVGDEKELAELVEKYEVKGTLLLQRCDGKRLELVVLKKRTPQPGAERGNIIKPDFPQRL